MASEIQINSGLAPYGQQPPAVQITKNTLFSPLYLPGLRAWFRSDLGITLNGAKVSAWADQSGNGNHATQGTAAKQPTYNASDAAYNGLPSLSFLNASATVLVTGAVTTGQPATVAIVGQATKISANGGFTDAGSGSGYLAVYATSTNSFASMISNATGFNSTTDISAQHVVAGAFNGASSKLFVDNSQIPVATGTCGSAAATTLAIGGNGLGVNPLTGKVAELVVVNRILSPGEMTLLFAYYGARYGIGVS